LPVGILSERPAVIGAIPALEYLHGWASEAGEGITASINNSLRAGTFATFIVGTAAVTLVALARFWERRLVLYQQVVEFHVVAEGHRNG
jgi:hypothetical protein